MEDLRTNDGRHLQKQVCKETGSTRQKLKESWLTSGEKNSEPDEIGENKQSNFGGLA
jgi:hypothetical protein